MNIQVCEDCNSYDDADMEDSFMVPFGDDMWLCELCLEARGVKGNRLDSRKDRRQDAVLGR